MKTLYKKRIKTLNDKLEPTKEGLYFGEDVKEFIKELLEISKENNWEVAIDDGYKEGFRTFSGEEWIKNKSGFNK